MDVKPLTVVYDRQVFQTNTIETDLRTSLEPLCKEVKKKQQSVATNKKYVYNF
jgi:hypothetical protein